MTARSTVAPRRRALRPFRVLLCASVLAGALAACSDDDDNTVSVFAVKPGECFTAPKSVQVQLSTLARVACGTPHTLEAYAIAEYKVPGSVRTQVPSAPTKPGIPTAIPTAAPKLPSGSASLDVESDYPGAAVLKKFADGACAQRFGPYVGVDYLDSSLFYTYLLPSARSWEQSADRNVTCFVTTTGGKVKGSVKGTKR